MSFRFSISEPFCKKCPGTLAVNEMDCKLLSPLSLILESFGEEGLTIVKSLDCFFLNIFLCQAKAKSINSVNSRIFGRVLFHVHP